MMGREKGRVRGCGCRDAVERISTCTGRLKLFFLEPFLQGQTLGESIMVDSGGGKELEILEASLRRCPTDLALQQKILTYLRMNRIRRPDLVLRCGLNILKKGTGRLGNTVWDVREQVL